MPAAPKALATIAFLKARLDEGHDHLGLFEPFVVDALLHLSTQDFVAADVKLLVQQREQLVLPVKAVETLLGRCVKRGLLRRSGGRFWRTSLPIEDRAFEVALSTIQHEQDSLGRALASYAAAQGVQFEPAEVALSALATFVSDNKVDLVLNEVPADSPLERSSLDRKVTRVIARFITEHCLASPELQHGLAALTEGMVLHDTLLLKDIPDASRRFKQLVVVLDTGILFAAIDLMGVANGVVAKEGLALLREAGAKTIAFDRTLDEMRRILAVYEQHLGTTAGILSLYPTALTQYVVRARLSPADIRIISTTLETRLEKVGVRVQEVPAHDARFTLDEQNLAKRLTAVERPDPGAPRITHDVDCVAGILTLRAGRGSTSMEQCRAIFCTGSGRVVGTVQQWFVSQGEAGMPPIVHETALTSLAWLKKPAAAPDLKMHELAALCLAAMRPTRATWMKFVSCLRRLKTEGHITDDETAAIVASELTESFLARLDDEFEPDSDSLGEAVERVREAYRRDAALAAEQKVAKTQQAAEEAVRAAQAEAALAQQAAAEAVARKSQISGAIERSITRFSRRAADTLFYVCFAAVGFSTLLSLPGVPALSGPAKWIARVIWIAAAGLGVYGQVYGPSVKEVRAKAENQIAMWMRNRWLPEGFSAPPVSKT